MVEVQPVPPRLVDEQGRVCFGVFDAPCPAVNIEDTRLKWHGMTLSPGFSRWRMKQWQHAAVITPELMLGFAAVDAGYLRTSWCHVLDRATGTHFEHGRKGPRLDLRTARELWDDRTFVHAREYCIDVHNHLKAGEHRVEIEIAAGRKRPAVRADLVCAHDLDAIEPLVLVMPVGDNRGAYSHKVVLPCSGSIAVGEQRHELDPEQSFGIWDVHKAHYPRKMFWNWATGAGRLADGRSFGFNLTRNVNTEDERINENVVWLQGKRHHLAPARFEIPRSKASNAWRVRTADEALDLRFQPQGERAEALRLGVVQSVFHQPYGEFSGRAVVAGEDLEIRGLFGVCEDHRAVW